MILIVVQDKDVHKGYRRYKCHAIGLDIAGDKSSYKGSKDVQIG